MIDAFIRFCFSGSSFYLYYKMTYLIQFRVLSIRLFVLKKAITISVPPKIMGPNSYRDIISSFFNILCLSVKIHVPTLASN